MSKVALVKCVVAFVAALGGSVTAQVIPNLPNFTSDGRIPLGLAGTSLRYRASILHSEPTAFIFDWKDGTTTREPPTGFLNPFNGAVLSDYVFHTWNGEGVFLVTVTAVDNLGATSTSAPLAVTIYPAIVCGDGICDPGPVPALPGETCTNCMADCGACAPICTDGVCDPGESCVTCSPDCGLCIHAGNSTVGGFTSRIGMLRVGGSQTWQVGNPVGITLANSTATMYRNPQGTGVGSGQKSVEDLWVWLRTPERMAQAGFSTLPVEINASNQFTLSNSDGSTWPFGTWSFFLAWDVGNGAMVVTPITQMIVPSQAVQDPWSLFGGLWDQPGHTEWGRPGTPVSTIGVGAGCSVFETVQAKNWFYIPFDFCPIGQDCGPGMGFVFSVYRWSDGFTFVSAPSWVGNIGASMQASVRVFAELGTYAVTARIWDQSMTNPSNTLSAVMHISGFSPVCPNGLCDGFETFSACPEDCAAGCGDGVCGAGEDCNNCKADCGRCAPICGDGICECPIGNFMGEDCNNCVADCGVCTLPCGNGTCDRFTEDCSACAVDCGACPSVVCNECATNGDGLFCNGAEACIDGICQATAPPIDCNDGVACTDDLCNEATNSCDNIPNNANCDNGLFCDGSETCHALFGCQPGVDPCSGQGCDEGTNSCNGCLTDGDCDDGIFCNGMEACANAVCQSGTPPTCDDSNACTLDACDLVTDLCANDAMVPCCGNGTCDAGEDCNTCTNDCFSGAAVASGCGNGICESFAGENCKDCPEDCAGTRKGPFCCGDGSRGTPVPCSDPRCNANGLTCSDLPSSGSCCGDGVCEATEAETNCAVDCGTGCAVDADCDDGVFCNGVETCLAGGCQTGAAPCDDGVACTDDTCDELLGACANTPKDVNCDNGQFCDGVETCDAAFGCVVGNAVNCDDLVACTVDSCNETTNSCNNAANDAACDNGLFCDGLEFCDVLLGCRASAAVNCDDGVACTVDSCNEIAGSCDNAPNNANCDNGLFCDGAETCDVVAGCLAGTDPCPGQACDEINGACASCLSGADCDDGLVCNGAETCVGGICQGGTPVNCDDAVACTVDACNEATGLCDHIANDPFCADGLFCNGVEFCDAVLGCLVGVAVNCDDAAPCTIDSCNETTDACNNMPDPAFCDDGNACTADSCSGGLCFNDPIIPCCGDVICDAGEDACSCSLDCGAPPTAELNCTDGVDGDCDGFTDCDDADCAGDPACTACKPDGEPCTFDAECCGDRCRERKGAIICD